MSRIILVVAAAASAVTASVGTLSVASLNAQPTAGKQIMMESDFGQIRRQALAAHPLGSNIASVAEAMKQLGFRCQFRPHLVENTTAPTVLCDSNGHSQAGSTRLDIDLIARNGVLADIRVSNGLDGVEASAVAPNPGPGGKAAAPIARPVPDPEWDAILTSSRKQFPGP